MPQLPAQPHDIVVLALRVNDAFSLTTAHGWHCKLRALFAKVRERAEPATIVLTGKPPVHRFPALLQPLAGFLGLRARLLDTIARVAAADGDAVHGPAIEADAETHLCADGVHPSLLGYALRARGVAATLNAVCVSRACVRAN